MLVILDQLGLIGSNILYTAIGYRNIGKSHTSTYIFTQYRKLPINSHFTLILSNITKQLIGAI